MQRYVFLSNPPKYLYIFAVIALENELPSKIRTAKSSPLARRFQKGRASNLFVQNSDSKTHTTKKNAI